MIPSSRSATSAAAPPPTPLNSATSCGICGHRDPPGGHDTGGRANSDRREDQGEVVEVLDHEHRDQGEHGTGRTDQVAPRAVFGRRRPLRARMKQTAATR